MSIFDDLKTKFDRFIDLAQARVRSQPWLVVTLMHEYFRHLYPSDPYLPFPEADSASARISSVLDACIGGFEAASPLGSYFVGRPGCMEGIVARLAAAGRKRADEATTQQVYGKLWDAFDVDVYTKEALQILRERLETGDFRLSSLKGAKVLDMGCGSGRYAIALAMCGAARVHGVDLGAASIETGAAIAQRTGLSNIEFHTGNVLELPYRDGEFDFVFCNGVLHHTTNMEQGIRELHRVLKPGGRAFLYLYADGGLFWYSRKKMPVVMKQIPQEYTMAVLQLLGMPSNRFVFVDNWYVPIERHTSRAYLEQFLRETGFAAVVKIHSGRATDLDNSSLRSRPDAEVLWGDGEHRYLLTKA
ncbi:MAG TPA: methyltransferase domain-containing protein [Phycisphaerae bacterium]|nr:methyltransferase domain-containing protein [Phycisphaerae bacterium]